MIQAANKETQTSRTKSTAREYPPATCAARRRFLSLRLRPPARLTIEKYRCGAAAKSQNATIVPPGRQAARTLSDKNATMRLHESTSPPATPKCCQKLTPPACGVLRVSKKSTTASTASNPPWPVSFPRSSRRPRSAPAPPSPPAARPRFSTDRAGRQRRRRRRWRTRKTYWCPTAAAT